MSVKDLKIKLRTARINANLTLQKVASKTGYSTAQLSNWENGLKIDKADLKKLCKLYKIDEKNVVANIKD